MEQLAIAPAYKTKYILTEVHRKTKEAIFSMEKKKNKGANPLNET